MKIELHLGEDNKKIKSIASALSNYARLEIVDLIKGDNQNLNYTAVADSIQKSPTTVTSHMRNLIESELVEVIVTPGKRGRTQKIPKLKIDKIIIDLNE